MVRSHEHLRMSEAPEVRVGVGCGVRASLHHGVRACPPSKYSKVASCVYCMCMCVHVWYPGITYSRMDEWMVLGHSATEGHPSHTQPPNYPSTYWVSESV